MNRHHPPIPAPKQARKHAGVVLPVLVLPALFLPSCVDRKIRVTSEPPGATVWLNDVEIGRTPAEADFTFYGRYDVRLEKDGYEPLWTNRKAGAPFWQWPGPDLIAEAIPLRFDDVVEWHFELTPALESTTDPETLEAGLIERAHRLKHEVGGDSTP